MADVVAESYQTVRTLVPVHVALVLVHVVRLDLVEFCHYAHPDALIEGTAHKQPFLVWRPVKACNGLR